MYKYGHDFSSAQFCMCVACSDQSAPISASDVTVASSPAFEESLQQQSSSDSVQNTSQIGNVESANVAGQGHESPSSTVDDQRSHHSGRL